jgi:hypothetical protein
MRPPSSVIAVVYSSLLKTNRISFRPLTLHLLHRRIEHAKYLLEKARNAFLTSDRWKHMAAQRAKTRAAAAAKRGSDTRRMSSKMGSGMGGMGSKDKSQAGDAKVPQKAAEKPTKGEEKGSEEPACRGVHVAVLLHLQRGDVQFLLEFSKVWRQAFIDDLDASGNTGTKAIETMRTEQKSRGRKIKPNFCPRPKCLSPRLMSPSHSL